MATSNNRRLNRKQVERNRRITNREATLEGRRTAISEMRAAAIKDINDAIAAGIPANQLPNPSQVNGYGESALRDLSKNLGFWRNRAKGPAMGTNRGRTTTPGATTAPGVGAPRPNVTPAKPSGAPNPIREAFRPAAAIRNMTKDRSLQDFVSGDSTKIPGKNVSQFPTQNSVFPTSPGPAPAGRAVTPTAPTAAAAPGAGGSVAFGETYQSPTGYQAPATIVGNDGTVQTRSVATTVSPDTILNDQTGGAYSKMTPFQRGNFNRERAGKAPITAEAFAASGGKLTDADRPAAPATPTAPLSASLPGKNPLDAIPAGTQGTPPVIQPRTPPTTPQPSAVIGVNPDDSDPAVAAGRRVGEGVAAVGSAIKSGAQAAFPYTTPGVAVKGLQLINQAGEESRKFARGVGRGAFGGF